MTFRLGDWFVEPSMNRLSRPGESVRLEPRVMDLLVLLAGAPERSGHQTGDPGSPLAGYLRDRKLRLPPHLRSSGGPSVTIGNTLATWKRFPRRDIGSSRRASDRLETGETRAPDASARLRSKAAAVLVVVALVGAALFIRALGRPHGPRTSVDAATRDAYLRGEVFENRVDCRSFDRAIGSYREAMHRDRGFVDVYPRLFDALVASAVLGCHPPEPLFSELASLVSLARESGLDETRRTQGEAALALWRDGNVAEALSEFQRASEEATSSDTDDLSYAVTLVVSGRPEAGLDAARRALDALPVDLGENWALGGILYLTGRYEQAVQQFHRTLELYPGYRPAEQLLALSYLMAGNRARALALATKSEAQAETMPEEPIQRFDAVPGFIFAVLGEQERARQVLARWTARSETDWVPKTSLALLHLGLGERDAAIRWLEEAKRERDPWLVLVSADPAFGALAADSAIAGGDAEAKGKISVRTFLTRSR